MTKNLPPPPPYWKGTGRMNDVIAGLKPNEPAIIKISDRCAAYDASKVLRVKIRTSERDFPGHPKLKPGTCRVWKIS